jgi:peptidoglycan/xylan/chitin deacetylase (PgdA/CDA1 family)
VLTFDDAYENLYHHALPVLEAFGVPFEVFVIGGRIGRWNDFDPAEPPTRHKSLSCLEELTTSGGRLQWHSSTHPHLPSIDDDSLLRELTVPGDLRLRFPAPHFAWMAYPGGWFDDRALQVARRQFAGAVSVTQGSQTHRWCLNRVTVDRDTAVSQRDLAEIIRNPLIARAKRHANAKSPGAVIPRP